MSLSSVKRRSKRYDGTLQSLLERSHRPHSHPRQHTQEEEAAIWQAFSKAYLRYGWDGMYSELLTTSGCTHSVSGMYHAATRMGKGWGKARKRPSRASRRYPELSAPGEKVQIDVKEAPYSCVKGAAKRDGKHLYQWTVIDECTRFRFVYSYEEHTPENSINFFKRLQEYFPFPIKTVQSDNGTEFTYRFISDTEKCPFEKLLFREGIKHKLIPPRTPDRFLGSHH